MQTVSPVNKAKALWVHGLFPSAAHKQLNNNSVTKNDINRNHVHRKV